MIRAVTDPTWERYGAAAGFGAAVLLAIQIVVAPLYPWHDDPALGIVGYYATNASAIRVQIVLSGLAGVLFLWWLGALRVHLRRAEGEGGGLGDVAFAGGIAAAAVAAFGAVVTLAATHGATPVARSPLYGQGLPFRPEIVSIAYHELRLDAYTVAWFALVPMLAVVAIVAMRDGAFPRWHMGATLALAVLSLGTGLSVLIDTGPFAPGGVYTLVLYALFVVWLAVTAWLLMRPLEPWRDTRPRPASPHDSDPHSPGYLPSPPREDDLPPGDRAPG